MIGVGCGAYGRILVMWKNTGWRQIKMVTLRKKKDMIMKIFILSISLFFGVLAIVVYAYGLKHRLKELTDRPDENNL